MSERSEKSGMSSLVSSVKKELKGMKHEISGFAHVIEKSSNSVAQKAYSTLTNVKGSITQDDTTTSRDVPIFTVQRFEVHNSCNMVTGTCELENEEICERASFQLSALFETTCAHLNFYHQLCLISVVPIEHIRHTEPETNPPSMKIALLYFSNLVSKAQIARYREEVAHLQDELECSKILHGEKDITISNFEERIRDLSVENDLRAKWFQSQMNTLKIQLENKGARSGIQNKLGTDDFARSDLHTVISKKIELEEEVCTLKQTVCNLTQQLRIAEEKLESMIEPCLIHLSEKSKSVVSPKISIFKKLSKLPGSLMRTTESEFELDRLRCMLEENVRDQLVLQTKLSQAQQLIENQNQLINELKKCVH